MRRIGMVGWIMVGLLLIAHAGFADQGGKPGSTAQRRVAGVVSKVHSGLLLIQTPEGQMAVSSRRGPGDLKVGEQVEMQMNEHDAVIVVHRIRAEKNQAQRPQLKLDSQGRGQGTGKTGDPGLIF